MMRYLQTIVLIGFGVGSAAGQSANWTVAFDDTAGAYTSFYDQLTASITAAGAEWNRHLRPVSSVNIQIEVRFDSDVDRLTGRSTTSSFVRQLSNGMNVFEQGVGAMLRTGFDPNGANQRDVEIVLNPSFLQTGLWFDPNPATRTATVAPNQVDAISAFTHELGHAIAINGFRDGTTGELPAGANFMSTFDERVTRVGDFLQFSGPSVDAVYGGPVPLTLGNYAHIGNADGPGSDLADDLMNGLILENGRRYFVSEVDVAILSDTGIPVAFAPVPEPGAILLIAAAAGLIRRATRRSGV